jgi:hypothetical protein
MASSNTCLYCPALASSDEHVISEALGCKEIISEGVCRGCNNEFGHGFEGKFINGLALFLNFFKVPNGQGIIPSVRLQGKIGNEEFKFVITGDGKADIHPMALRIFQKSYETKIEGALRSRYSDLVWKRLQGTDVKQIIDVQAGFDAELLCSTDANRTIAKYALNLLVYQYGYEWVRNGLQNLIAYVNGEASSTLAGILWEPSLLSRFPFEPPKHLFVIVCDSKSHTVTVFLYLFCLFPFCVITEEPTVTIDSSKSGAIDPYKGRFTPLFLGGSPVALGLKSLLPFPMPEYEFAELLRRSEIGKLRQAVGAAKNGVLFMKAIYSGQSGTPHICYHCKKNLAQLTRVCEYCGKSPLPEIAVS